MIQLKMSENGRVVIPMQVREDLGLRSGGTLLMESRPEGLFLTTKLQRIKQAQALVARVAKERGTDHFSWTDALIADRRAEVAKEEAEFKAAKLKAHSA